MDQYVLFVLVLLAIILIFRKSSSTYIPGTEQVDITPQFNFIGQDVTAGSLTNTTYVLSQNAGDNLLGRLALNNFLWTNGGTDSVTINGTSVSRSSIWGVRKQLTIGGGGQVWYILNAPQMGGPTPSIIDIYVDLDSISWGIPEFVLIKRSKVYPDLQCDEHSTATVTGCVCNAGYYGTGDTLNTGGAALGCNLCPSGYYCPGGANWTQCTTSANYSVSGSVAETACGLQCLTTANGGTQTAATTNSAAVCYCNPGSAFSVVRNATSSYYQNACIGCNAGYSLSGSSTTPSTCVACGSGYYQSNPNGTSCPICAAGKSTQGVASAATSCVDCIAGSVGPAAGTVNCTSCNSGSYVGTAGQTQCQTCAGGNYSGPTGLQTQCSQCGAGTYSLTGASQCTNCDAGTYSPTGATQCTNCDAGTYSPTAAPQCTNCVAGTYSPAGATQCTNCGAGTWSIPGATACITWAGSDQLVAYGTATGACPAGQYGRAGGGCSTCPGGQTSVAGSVGIAACYTPCAATGSKVAAAATRTTGATCQCVAGYVGTGTTCAQCSAGTTYSSVDGATSCSAVTSCSTGYTLTIPATTIANNTCYRWDAPYSLPVNTGQNGPAAGTTTTLPSCVVSSTMKGVWVWKVPYTKPYQFVVNGANGGGYGYGAFGGHGAIVTAQYTIPINTYVYMVVGQANGGCGGGGSFVFIGTTTLITSTTNLSTSTMPFIAAGGGGSSGNNSAHDASITSSGKYGQNGNYGGTNGGDGQPSGSGVISYPGLGINSLLLYGFDKASSYGGGGSNWSFMGGGGGGYSGGGQGSNPYNVADSGGGGGGSLVGGGMTIVGSITINTNAQSANGSIVIS